MSPGPERGSMTRSGAVGLAHPSFSVTNKDVVPLRAMDPRSGARLHESQRRRWDCRARHGPGRTRLTGCCGSWTRGPGPVGVPGSVLSRS